MSNKYKPSFGIKKQNKIIYKGERGIGFKLTVDNNYDIDNKKLTNVADPNENKDAINKDYFDNVFTSFKGTYLKKNEDVDMNGKAIKNLSWPHDNNDAVPKKYLYLYGLLFDNKSNSFNAKDKKIVKALDPEDQQDVATKNYVDNLDSAIQDSMVQRINKLKTYVDEKINSTTSGPMSSANFTAMSYSLELSSITTSYLDIVDKLRLIQVNSHVVVKWNNKT